MNEQYLEQASDMRSVMTVGQFSAFLKKNLEDFLDSVWIAGELSGVFLAKSGHIYCQIKDREAQFKVVIFRGVASKLPFEIQEGLQVVLCAQISMYRPRGELQLIAKKIEPEGIGALKLAFEQLKEKLLTEGIFEQSIKKDIPDSVKTVGLVTSQDGAVLHDMINIIRRRDPTIQLVHYVCSVQGKYADRDIINALNQAADDNLCQVYILARGGGSLEDLWTFNTEKIVRAIHTFPHPIISAVGHETDVTLADFAADKRASTPSMAAEIVTLERNFDKAHWQKNYAQLGRQMSLKVDSLEQHLNKAILRHQQVFKAILNEAFQRFRLFKKQALLIRRSIDSQQQQLQYFFKMFHKDHIGRHFKTLVDQLNLFPVKMKTPLLRRWQDLVNDLNHRKSTLKIHRPSIEYLASYHQQLERYKSQVIQLTLRHIKRLKIGLSHRVLRLQALSYESTLHRGFVLVTDSKNGQLVKNASDLHKKQEYILNFHDGNARVITS